MKNFLLQLIMVAKLVFYGILLQCFSFSILLAHEGAAQDVKSVKEFKIDVEFKNSSIAEIFDKIEKKTGYHFVYDISLVKDKATYNESYVQTIVADILMDISKQYGYKFKQINKSIVVVEHHDKSIMGTVLVLQGHEVTGKVISEEDTEGLPGVNVIIKGSSEGTVTDVNGNYTINVPSGETELVFSSVGFVSQELTVGNQTVLNVILNADVTALDEIVVVGYGIQKRLDVTGSISNIDAKVLANNPGFRVDQMLQGKASGMMVTQVNGAPGAPSSIRIRGNSSITASSEPLYVIDGLLGAGDLSTINPADIADISVLKDASATAIYGSRGANGVILITTKKGTLGSSQINVNVQKGYQWLPREIKLISGSQYAELLNESMIDKGSQPVYTNPDAVETTDWQKETMQTAPTTNINISTSGGSEKVRYYISSNYYNQEGIIKNTGVDRLQFRANVESMFNDKIKIGVDLNAGRRSTDNNTVPMAPEYSLLTTPSSMPIYNSDGTYNYTYPHGNFNGRFNTPVALQNLRTSKSLNANLMLNIYAEYSPFEWLVLKSTIGGQMINYGRGNNYTDSKLPGQTTNQRFGDGSISYSDGTNYQNENTASFIKQFGKDHFIDGVVGVTFQGGVSQSASAGAYGFIIDANTWNNLSAGNPMTRSIGSGYQNWSMVSYLARFNYKFKDRYLITATGRYDGSSRLGDDNQWVFFPSIALGWIASEESFIKDWDALSFLKFKASYGSVGNQAVGIYQTMSVLSSVNSIVNGERVSGWLPGDVSGNVTLLGNPNLRWEVKDQLDIGIEANFFNDRLNFMFDYYDATTKDLLLLTEIPSQIGYTQMMSNVGKVSNTGIDITVSTVNIENSKFKWTTRLTLSHNENKVMQLGPTGADIVTHNYTWGVKPIGILRVGEPVGSFYGYISDGIWKENQGGESIMAGAKAGSVRYKDVNNDGIINQGDNVILGNGSPSWYGGFGTDLSYKGLGLGIFFTGATGAKIFNGNAPFLRSTEGQYNHYTEVLDRWHPINNPESDVPGALNIGRETNPSDRWVFDASYLRLESVNITYSIPVSEKTKKYIQSATINLTGWNLFVLSPYNDWGYDPVINQKGGTNLGYNDSLQGFDYGAYPKASSFSIGVNLIF